MVNSNATVVNRFWPGFFSILYASIISAHFIISIGDERNLLDLILSREYFISLAYTGAAAFAVVFYVSWIDSNLNLFYDWRGKFLERLFYQIVLALVLPAFLVYVLTAFVHYLLGTGVRESGFLVLKFPVAILLLVILNLLLIISYLVNSLLKDDGQEHIKPFVWVHKSGRNIPISHEEIAYIFHKDQYNYLRTLSGQDFMINHTLDEMQHKLPATEFFRANRQIIINISACSHYETIEFGKLRLEIKPDFDRAVIVSQKRARDFKKWAGKP
ncbi:LytR/AlgR family response regulator transcription factor [Aquiflexum sp.]|uniref:LytR/AlgR family response regulator transcription factor n=1 Tax=Aquiflexum sp. TaxID=1872584 RepID=UPI0035932998